VRTRSGAEFVLKRKPDLARASREARPRWLPPSTLGPACALVACLGCVLWPPPRERFDTGPIEGPEFAPVRLTDHPDADEDPSVVFARDGRFFLVWSGRRNDGVHLRLRTSRDGRGWGAERRITAGVDEDHYPSLVQGREGSFHLAWFRLGREARKTEIWYTHSPDGQTFADPQRITNDPAQDRAPLVHEDADGVLWIVWSSQRSGNRELFAVRSSDGGRRWSPPDQLTRSAEEDDFPHLVESPDGARSLVWTRFHAGSGLRDYGRDTTSEIVMAQTREGLRLAPPVVCSPPDTEERYTEVLPSTFRHADGRMFLSWTSDRSDRRGDILLRELADSSAPVRQLTTSPQADYDGKVVPTPQRGEHLLVWVSTEAGNADIFARRFRP
jgi:hypothetical protein